MKTKKVLLLGLVAASLLASCKKNNDNNTAAGLGFKAITESNNGDSRTYLDGIDVKWMEGDAIKVANADGAQQVFDLAGGATTMNGDFYDANVEESFYEPDYVALYPATNAADVANTIDEDGIATFNLPETQAITATGTFANKAMPMVAHSSTQTLPFKNVLGGLVIPLVGDGLHVSKVVLTSLEDTDKLWGVYTADCNSDDPVPTYVSGGSNQLKLSCDVALDPATPNDFIFMVPPGTLEKGFVVTAYDGTNKLFEFAADWTATPQDGFIPRSVLMKVGTNLGPTTSTLTVTTVSPTFITKNSAFGMGAATAMPKSCGILYALASDLTTPASDLVIGGANVTNLMATNTIVTTDSYKRFDAELTGLEEDAIYYVRAWATDAQGLVIYGNPIPFATRYDYFSSTNKGRSRGVFSVYGSANRVRFSMGNLQYLAKGYTANGTTWEDDTWRFAEYQFDWVGDSKYNYPSSNVNPGLVYQGGMYPSGNVGDQCNNLLVAENYDGWIDVFGWGTSGIDDYEPRAVAYQPWTKNANSSAYSAYGNAYYNLNDQSGKADWGYNAIINGGNVRGQWRTLQSVDRGSNRAEWSWLLESRPDQYRYAVAQLTVRGISSHSLSDVGSVKACGISFPVLIIFPDAFDWPTLVDEFPASRLNSTRGYSGNQGWLNKLTEAQWSMLEQAGAILLPTRFENSMSTIVSGVYILHSFYWAASDQNGVNSYCLDCDRQNGLRPNTYKQRQFKLFVRLVCPAE